MRKKRESTRPQSLAHSQHQFNRKQKADDAQYHSEELNITVKRLAENPEAYQLFFKRVRASWNSLTQAQKVCALIVLAVAAGCSIYFILQLTMQNEPALPTNKLSFEEQQAANQLMKTKVKINPQLLDKINNMPLSHLNNAERKHFEHSLKQYKKDLDTAHKNTLSILSDNTVNTQLQKKVIADKDFRVLITTSAAVDSGIAGYDSEKKEVLFAAQDAFNSRAIVQTWQNEMHHAMIHQRNQELGCVQAEDVLLLDEPFCDKGQWQVAVQSQALKQAIATGMKNLHTFYDLAKKVDEARPLSYEEQQQYAVGLEALAHYSPLSGHSELNQEQYYESFKPYMEPSSMLPDYPYAIASHKLASHYPCFSDMYIKIWKAEDGRRMQSFQYGHDKTDFAKISALMTEINLYRSSMKHEKATYFKRKEATKTAEMASFIDALPVHIKQHFFSDFCAYFSAYHGVDYCDHQDPAAYIPGK